MSQKALAAALVVASVTGGALLAAHFMSDAQTTSLTTTPTTLSPPAATTTKPARAATGRLAKPDSFKKTITKNQRKLELPDGTFVDTLNGAIDPPPLNDYWGTFEWSPIIGIERSSAGIDWYKHADGSYSTTEMVMRTDLGRKAAMTRVAHPGPAPATPAAKTTSPR